MLTDSIVSDFLKNRFITGVPTDAVSDFELVNELRRVQFHFHIFNELQANLLQNAAQSVAIDEVRFLRKLSFDEGAAGRVEFARLRLRELSEEDEALLIEMGVARAQFGGGNQFDDYIVPVPPPKGRTQTRAQLLKEATGAVELAFATLGSGAADADVGERLGLFSEQLLGRNHNPVCFSFDFRDGWDRSYYYQDDDDRYDTAVRHDDLAAELRRAVFRACAGALARPGAADDSVGVPTDHVECAALVADVHAAVVESEDLGSHSFGGGAASIGGAFALYESARVKLGMSAEIRNDGTMLELRRRMAASGRMPPAEEPRGATLFGRASRLEQVSVRDDSHAGRLVQRLALVCKVILAALLSRGLAGFESRPFSLHAFPSPNNLFVDDGETTEEDDSPVRKLPLGERVDGVLHEAERVSGYADAEAQADDLMVADEARDVLDRIEALLAASYAVPRRNELERAKTALLALV